MMRYLRALVLPAAMLFAPWPAQAEIILLTAELTGAQVVPGPGDPDGSGSASMTFDDVTNVFSWSIEYSDLSVVSSGHFHVAPPGLAGPVVIPFAPDLSPIAGSFDFDDFGADAATREAQLLSGQFYVDLHTPDFPGGAIRGQVLVLQVPEPATLALLALGLLGLGFARRRKQQ